MRVLLWIQYRGKGFAGFQRQPDLKTVAGELEQAIYGLFKRKVKVLGSSRTDAGAHAVCHPVSFEVPDSFQLEKLPAALNSFLPENIRAIEVKQVNGDFVPLQAAIARTYVYLVLKDARAAIYFNGLAYLPKRELTEEAKSVFKDALKIFQGKHDFSAFAKTRSSAKSTVRTIHEVAVFESRTLLAVVFTGNGFLYGQVRNIIGASFAAAFKKVDVVRLKEALETGKRDFPVQAVPAEGLYLYRVWFKDRNLNFEPHFPFLDIDLNVEKVLYEKNG